jgi:serine/arginine repetitive matrix protein 2
MKLNESGASDRASIVEQLEMAFKTPAKVDLHCEFSTHLRVEVPPLPPPPLPGSITDNLSSLGLEYPSRSQLLDVDEPSAIQTSKTNSTSQDSSSFDISVSQLVDVREPTLLHTDESEEQSSQSNELAHSTRSTQSGQSEGELNRSFKFGGRPDNTSHDHELTLSDIIPPPEFARAISEASLLDGIEDDSVLRSIYANGQGKYG